MSIEHSQIIASEFSLHEKYVKATIALLDEGGTVPFIARYRKEITGSLDEVAIASIRDRIAQLRELDKRKISIIKSIEEQGKLTKELKEQIDQASTMLQLEDIYLPYKPKRRTKATIAREKGLEPLALLLMEQTDEEIESKLSQFINSELAVNTREEALTGARDIVAEWINENAEVRSQVRNLIAEKGLLQSKIISGKEQEGIKYKDYFETQDLISKIPSHRLLAMRRGEKEMILLLDIIPPEEECIEKMEKSLIKSSHFCSQQVKIAIKDCFKRLMKPSIETEIRMITKKKADEEAIKVFAENLKMLLLAAPLGQKNVLAIDPGFRTGCKVVALDKQGKLLKNTTIYPHDSQAKNHESRAEIQNLCDHYSIEAIAIGNGTAGRETEQFIKTLDLPKSIQIVMVNESGASIYSASEVAREEFPEHDITVRGAVSIGRRLMDPLSELVKIDPKSIGVGQYQHDVDQHLLKLSLDDIVISSVNQVGVELNTASKEILSYVSGLGNQLAKNIVSHRNDYGPFESKEALKKVARMGEKAFEQAAGFLRIRDAQHPLDASAVHPESYHIVEKMAADMNCNLKDLLESKDLRNQINLNKYVSETVGLPTLKDILAELAKPGRDPREQFESIQFMEGVNKIEDLRVGMEMPAVITNVTKFGAFADIGVHQDGLIHLSQLANKYVSDASEVVKVHQKVKVKVVEIDIPRKRISLTMRLDNKIEKSNTKQPEKNIENLKTNAGNKFKTSFRIG